MLRFTKGTLCHSIVDFFKKVYVCEMNPKISNAAIVLYSIVVSGANSFVDCSSNFYFTSTYVSIIHNVVLSQSEAKRACQ